MIKQNPTPAERRHGVLTLYKTLLKSLSASVDDNGAIWLRVSETSDPIAFAHEGKQFYLPTDAVRQRQQVDREFAQNSILFNPLMEYPTTGESPKETATRYSIRKVANVMLNTAIRGLLTMSLQILASPSMHAKLEGDQRDLLKLYAKSESTYEYVSSLIEAIQVGDPEKRAAHIAYSSRVRIDDQEYLHAGVISFPIVTQALDARAALSANQSAKVMGVTVKSHAQIDLLLALLDYLMPGCSNGQPWKVFSVNGVAPRILAVYKAIYTLAEPLMQIQKLFEQFVPDTTLFQHDSQWMGEINTYQEMQELSIGLKLIGNGDSTQVGVPDPISTRANRRNDLVGDAANALASPARQAEPVATPARPASIARPAPMQQSQAGRPAGGAISLGQVRAMNQQRAQEQYQRESQLHNPVATAFTTPGGTRGSLGGGGIGGDRLRNMNF